MNNRETISKMVSVAHLYYMSRLTRSEIADRLGISRQLVSKLLDRAYEEGLVEIKIIDPFGLNNQLSQQLCDLTGLRDVIVVPSPKAQSELVKKSIGLGGANYLSGVISEGNVIGIGWGETMLEMINNLPSKTIPDTIIVPMMGGVGRIEPELQVNNLVMLFSRKTGSTPLPLYVPTVIDSKEAYDSLLTSASPVIDYWDKMDIAVVGIGITGVEVPPSNKLYQAYKTSTEREEMQELGAVGDIGMHFFDIHGNHIVGKIKYKLSMDLNRLKKLPLVIGMAGGLYKLKAIQGAIAGGYIHVLVTDENVAQELLIAFSKSKSARGRRQR